ncbi:hypothetical protein D3C72_2276310 [compost metagenome]
MSDVTVDMVQALEEHLILETPEHAVGTAHSSLLMKRIGEVIPVLQDFNPVISRRRKVDEDSLIDALMGTSGAKAEPREGGGAGAGSVTSSLMDKLRAKLGSK